MSGGREREGGREGGRERERDMLVEVLGSRPQREKGYIFHWVSVFCKKIITLLACTAQGRYDVYYRHDVHGLPLLKQTPATGHVLA